MKKYLLISVCLIVVVAIASVSIFIHHNNTIKENQNTGIKQLGELAKMSDYRTAEQDEIKEILANSEKAIKSEEDKKYIDGIVQDAENQISEIKTDEEYKKEERQRKLEEEKQKKLEEEKQKKLEEEKQKKLEEERQEKLEEEKQANKKNNTTSSGNQNSNSNGSSQDKNSGGDDSDGCVSDDAKNFY